MCAANKSILLVENVTLCINTRSNRVSNFKKPRTDPKTMIPANQKLSCWDQNTGSILKSRLFLSNWLIMIDNILVIGSDDPVRWSITLNVV